MNRLNGRALVYWFVLLVLFNLTDGFEQHQEGEHINTHSLLRPCATDCDCNRMMIPLTRDEHICYQCVAQVGRQDLGLCQKVAACATNHICSLMPRIKSDKEASELDQPTPISSFHCLPKITNTTIFRKLPQTCLSDEDCAFTGLAPLERISYTMTGYCLSSGYCRYPFYGLETNRRKNYQYSVLNHSECEWQPRGCKHKADCFPSPSRLQIDSSLISECDRLSLECERSNIPNDTAISSTFPTCQTEEDCYRWAQLHDSHSLAGNCYSCVNGEGTALPNRGRCVKTESNCTSGICLSGKCLAQACKDDLDCVNVAGKQSDCHSCDRDRGMCQLRQTCEDGAVCVRDHGADRHCSTIISPCSLFRTNITDDQRGRRMCLSLASGGLGYYRSTDYLHRISVARYNQYIQHEIKVGMSLGDTEIDLIDVLTLAKTRERQKQSSVSTTSLIPVSTKQNERVQQIGTKLTSNKRPVFVGTRMAVSWSSSSSSTTEGGIIQNPTQATSLSSLTGEGIVLGTKSPSIIHSNSIPSGTSTVLSTPTPPVYTEMEEVPVADAVMYGAAIVIAVAIIVVAWYTYLALKSLDLPVYFKKTIKKYFNGTADEAALTASEIQAEQILGILPTEPIAIEKGNTSSKKPKKRKIRT